MKIVAMSDTHNKYEDITVPDGDIFIIAGDVDIRTPIDVSCFAQWLDDLPHKHKIFVPGNHDTWIEDNFDLSKGMLADSCTMLMNNECTIDGFKVWGSPYTPEFNQWSFMCQRGKAMRRIWDQIPQDTDILITHGPMYGVMDWSVYDHIHCGCEELKKKIDIVNPKIHIFGHIHSGHGMQHVDNTTFINASIVDEKYNVGYSPTIIEI